jgi:hypothetical protein
MPITIDGSNGITQAGEFNSDSSFGFKNRIINGDMRIDQRNAGAAVTVNDNAVFFPVDRFFGLGQPTDGVFTLDQNTTAPAGFVNSVVATVTTADASLGATQYYCFNQYIEGTNVADLAWGTASAKTVTLSFWTRSSLTGTFGGVISNSAQNRSYPFTYSISVADTWEYKTVTIAGDTSGTWLTTTGIGIRLFFDLGIGSTYRGTAGSWAGATYLGATGATNVIGTLNATWYITGVQLEVGSTATSFDYRPYELALCQRYYYLHAKGSGFSIGVGSQYNASNGSIPVFFKQPMRTVPTLSVTSGSNYYIGYYNGTNATSSAPDLNASSTEMVGLLATNTSATAGNGLDFRTNNASSFVAFQAEF